MQLSSVRQTQPALTYLKLRGARRQKGSTYLFQDERPPSMMVMVVAIVMWLMAMTTMTTVKGAVTKSFWLRTSDHALDVHERLEGN